MKITTLASIGVVVQDLDCAIEDYAKFCDINEWTVNDWTADRLSEMVSHGRRSAGTYRSAIGSSVVDTSVNTPMGTPQRALTFELVQPTGGETPANEFYLSKGEGIAWLSVHADGDDAAVEAHFAELGIDRAHVEVCDGKRTRVFWDTRKQLGGYLLEVVPADLEVTGETRTFDGAALRENRRPLPLQGIHHFGVIVDDMMDALKDYNKIFGITKFDVKTWETGEGRLDAPYYRNLNPVQHGYFTAQGFCDDFGFEVIQMKYGPAHYNREFSDDRGQGIHHAFTFLTTSIDEWTEVSDSLTEMNAALCMGSDLRAGASEYGYWDTWNQLHGFLIEGVHRRYPADAKYMAPDFTVDFSPLIEEV